MKEICLILETNKTIALILDNKKLKEVHYINKSVFEAVSTLTSLPKTQKTTILFTEGFGELFAFSKDNTKKNELFRLISEKRKSSSFIYTAMETKKSYIVPTIPDETLTMIRKNLRNAGITNIKFATSLELFVMVNSFRQYKKPVLCKLSSRWAYFNGHSFTEDTELSNLFITNDTVLITPFPHPKDELEKQREEVVKKGINIKTARPWLSIKNLKIEPSVIDPEWGYLVNFLEEDNKELNIYKESFTVEKRGLTQLEKDLIGIGSVILITLLLRFAFQSFPINFKYIPIQVNMPENISFTEQIGIEELIYRKGQDYQLYYIRKDEQDAGYFISKERAIEYAKNNGGEVYAVSFKGAEKVKEDKVYP